MVVVVCSLVVVRVVVGELPQAASINIPATIAKLIAKPARDFFTGMCCLPKDGMTRIETETAPD